MIWYAGQLLDRNAYNSRDGQTATTPAISSAGVNRPILLCAATPSRRLVPRLMCLDQPLAGCFGADAWQAMHGATPGSEISNEVCANCQIRTTTLKMQSTKTRISSAVLPFSCERTNSL
jgi:hypothetical protein